VATYTWRGTAESGKKAESGSKELQAFVEFFVELDRAVREAEG
jgi:hypothetical protein